MKNIAIFVSGEGQAAERIVKLFNEGNRLRTVLVVTDETASDLRERLRGEDVIVLNIPENEWHEKSDEIAELLKVNEVKLLVLDNFALSLSDEIMEATDGELVRVSSPDLAPKEVVNALEADLRRPVETPEPQPEETEKDPTPESEWADALKIQYRPPKIPTTPPEVPSGNANDIQQETPEINPVESEPRNPYYDNTPQRDPYRNDYRNDSLYDYNRREERREERENREEMPSTYLIWSVLVTVFCCFIPGIIAIIFSSQVSNRYYSGDFEGARRASRMAEIWIIVSFVLGVLTATLYLPFMIIGN